MMVQRTVVVLWMTTMLRSCFLSTTAAFRPSLSISSARHHGHCWFRTTTTSTTFTQPQPLGSTTSSNVEETSAAESESKPKQRMRILSGVQPTGSLHLGNYLGAMKQWVDLQETADTYFCVVDWHAITNQPHDVDSLHESSLAAAALYMAIGIDPKVSTIFIQSHVPAHTELTWYLQCLTPVSWLNRMIQFKEKSAKSTTTAGTGLLTYPVLMAADILLYQATHVPVGEDQRQHLELTRDICRRVNDQFGKGKAFKRRMKAHGLNSRPIFREPEALIVESTARIMSLTDGTRKMSKSDPDDNSRINLLDAPDVIRSKLKRAKTDTYEGIYYAEDRPEATNLLDLYVACSGDSNVEVFREMRWGSFKEVLAEAVVAHLAPIQARYGAIRDDDASLKAILEQGATTASQEANATLHKTKVALGFMK